MPRILHLWLHLWPIERFLSSAHVDGAPSGATPPGAT